MCKLNLLTIVTTGLILMNAAVALAGKKIIRMNLTDAAGIGEEVGTVTLEDTEYGLLITPNLDGLTPGLHGFHIHENAACGPGVSAPPES